MVERALAMPEGMAAWNCVFCSQLRLVPWGRPFPENPPVVECRRCGDLCVANVDPEVARKALAHVITEDLI